MLVIAIQLLTHESSTESNTDVLDVQQAKTGHYQGGSIYSSLVIRQQRLMPKDENTRIANNKCNRITQHKMKHCSLLGKLWSHLRCRVQSQSWFKTQCRQASRGVAR
jgi:hypothetical protein